MLELSLPSVITTSTFLSRCAFFRCWIDISMASRMAVPPRASIRASAVSSSAMSLVKSLSFGIVQVGGVVEVDDEDLVVAVGVLHQRQRRGLHLVQLVAHAAAVVDHQAERNRNVFALELADLLLDLVLVDREGGLRQAWSPGGRSYRSPWCGRPRCGYRRERRWRFLAPAGPASAAAMRRQSWKERIIIWKPALFLRHRWDRPGRESRNSRCACEPWDCPGL